MQTPAIQHIAYTVLFFILMYSLKEIAIAFQSEFAVETETLTFNIDFVFKTTCFLLSATLLFQTCVYIFMNCIQFTPPSADYFVTTPTSRTAIIPAIITLNIYLTVYFTEGKTMDTATYFDGSFPLFFLMVLSTFTYTFINKIKHETQRSQSNTVKHFIECFFLEPILIFAYLTIPISFLWYIPMQISHILNINPVYIFSFCLHAIILCAFLIFQNLEKEQQKTACLFTLQLLFYSALFFILPFIL